ncbi:MAG TPA: hypothetical protein VEX15_18455 [Nocardioidaceae bacterium]|nr:hypothetical protein [Nocardioidaceae bacterium]
MQVARRLALVDTDLQIGRFVDFLHDSGRWGRSVLIVLADHSMDWSVPQRFVRLAPALDADRLLADRVAIADNGGADLLTWTGPVGDRDRAIRRMRAIASDVPGVLALHKPDALRLGRCAGDLVAYCLAGWRFSEPDPISNPIPGNHGHPATKPIPFFISGGSPLMRPDVCSARATTLDVAPTVGKIFGLPSPRGGYDGAPRL